MIIRNCIERHMAASRRSQTRRGEMIGSVTYVETRYLHDVMSRSHRGKISSRCSDVVRWRLEGRRLPPGHDSFRNVRGDSRRLANESPRRSSAEQNVTQRRKGAETQRRRDAKAQRRMYQISTDLDLFLPLSAAAERYDLGSGEGAGGRGRGERSGERS